MAIIQTQRNVVYAYDPQPDDVFVQVGWTGPGDGRVRQTFVGRYQPISAYREVVDWAVGMADQMVHPLYVVPLNHGDIFNTGRWTPFRKFIAGMNDQERGELRHIVMTTALELMRDSDDEDIRSDMFDVLVQLKVIRP